MTNEEVPEDLVHRAQDGDTDAFARLVERYRGRLEVIATARMAPALRRKLSVEDALQETFTRGLESIARFEWRGDDSFLHWLGGILRNVIAQAARRERVSCELELTSDFSRSATSPSRRMRREERLERLERALRELTAEQREVIALSRIDGLKIREIAERTGRSSDAVKQLVVRGLRSLRKRFGETESLHLPDRPIDPESLRASTKTDDKAKEVTDGRESSGPSST